MFLPQYNPYQRQEDPVAALAMGTLLWMLLIILSLFLLSAWLTKLFFQHVLNPYLDGALDREDGLVVLGSTLVWTVIAWVFSLPGLLPLFVVASFDEVVRAFLSVTGAGIAWGAAIGAFLVIHLWLEIKEGWEPTYGFAQVTNLSPEHYASTPVEAADQPALSLEEVEELVMQTAWQEADEMTAQANGRDAAQTTAATAPDS